MPLVFICSTSHAHDHAIEVGDPQVFIDKVFTYFTKVLRRSALPSICGPKAGSWGKLSGISMLFSSAFMQVNNWFVSTVFA